MIEKYEVGYRTMISSFNPIVLDAVVAESAAGSSQDGVGSGFLVQSLRNPWGMDDVLEYATPEALTGINIEFA